MNIHTRRRFYLTDSGFQAVFELLDNLCADGRAFRYHSEVPELTPYREMEVEVTDEQQLPSERKANQPK